MPYLDDLLGVQDITANGVGPHVARAKLNIVAPGATVVDDPDAEELTLILPLGEGLYGANDVVVGVPGVSGVVPTPLNMPASTMLARLATGDIVAASVTEIKALLGDGSDSTARAAAAAAQATADAAVPSALYDANTILAATTDNTPAPLTVGPSTIVGRKATGGIVALAAADVAALINGQALNDSVAGAAAATAASAAATAQSTATAAATAAAAAQTTANAAVPKSLMGAESLLAAVSAGTPVSLSVPASSFVGRKATGDVAALTAAEAAAVLYGQALNDSVAGAAAATAATAAAAAQSTANAAVPKSLYDTSTILAADVDNTPAPLTVGASTIVGRKATGGIVALAAADVAALINGQALNDSVAGAAAASAAAAAAAAQTTANAAIPKSTMGAESVLAAVSAGTPVSLSVPASSIVGRKATGDVAALTAADVATIISGQTLNDAAAVPKTLYDAYTILSADVDNTPAALTVAPSTLVGRKASGGIVAATAAEVAAILNGQNLADSASIAKSLMGAESVLAAVSSGTPVSLSVPASSFVGRKATGDVAAMTVSDALALLGLTSNTFSVATDINPYHWYRADNVSSSGGLVDTIIDAGTAAKNFTQSGTPRCPVATDANGKVYLAPDGANDYYQAGIAADWKFLNDGTPWTVMMVLHRTVAVSATESLVDTTDNTTGSTGMFMALGFTSSTVQGLLVAMTNSNAGNFLLSVRSYIPNTNLMVVVARHTGYSTDVTAGARSVPIDMTLRRNGAVVANCGNSGSSSPPPYPSTNPSNTLTLFRRSSTSGSFFGGRLYDLIIHNNALSDRQVLGYENYARAQYGVAI